MFSDLNVLYHVKEELRDGPDADFHDRTDGARWEGFMAWSDAQFDAAVDAKHAYMFTHLDRRPLDQRPRWVAACTHPVQPPRPRRWHALVAAHAAQEPQEEQLAGAARKKQKH